ncbi:MAG: DNA polymerase III subunit delta [Eggerthellaceae bacterium]|nr:DNA polymerase III subunit delta [Eggerthellaceae bacterium]
MAKTKSKEPEFLSAYLIVGDDALKRQAVSARLRKRIAEHGDPSFNSDEFKGETATVEEIITACKTIPFASDLRLVYIKDAEKLKKPETDAIVDYLKNPSETTVLALEAVKLAKNTRLYKAVDKIGPSSVIDCTLPKASELPRQVRAMATTYGVTFSPEAAEVLVSQVGTDTVRLDSEIKKIVLAHKGRGPVDAPEVLQMSARTTEYKPWQFVDAFSARDAKKCISLLNHMDSTSPYMLIAACTTRIRELICAKSLAERGMSYQLAKELKMPDWRVKNHGVWASRFSAGELRDALKSSRDAERLMKTTPDAESVFLDWVLATLS